MTFSKKAFLATATLAMSMVSIEFAFGQDDFTGKLGGRLHVDYATASSNNTDFGLSATALRRARIQMNYFNSDANLSGANTGPSLGLQDVYAAAIADPTLTEDTVDGFVGRLQFDF